MFTPSSSFPSLIEFMIQRGACDGGIAWGRSLGDVDCQAGLHHMYVDSKFTPCIAVWVLGNMNDVIDEDFANQLIAYLVTKPRYAAECLHSYPKALSDDQKIALARSFVSVYQPDGNSVFPVLESELRQAGKLPCQC